MFPSRPAIGFLGWSDALITPTYDSNKAIWDIAEIDEDNDVYEPTIDVLKRIIALINAERKEWEAFWKDLKARRDRLRKQK